MRGITGIARTRPWPSGPAAARAGRPAGS